MLLFNNISLSLRCQQFECNSLSKSEDEVIIEFHSTRNTEDVVCPVCGGRAHIYGNYTTRIKDIPFYVGTRQILEVSFHRYRCRECGKTFSEDNIFSFPGTRITHRAAEWIRELLKWQFSIKAISEITGVHWETVRRLHTRTMNEAIEERQRELLTSGYKPEYIAVDEFAIHKGHSYATCVMDLRDGDIIWAGLGRSKDSFRKFFEEIDMDYLSDVKAVAMDMNASYHILFQEYLTHAEIVYDRYHMQAQFGKDVLGVVRLAEARAHRDEARALDEKANAEPDPAIKKEIRAEARNERAAYTTLKRARWPLLMNSTNLTGRKAEKLEKILSSHEELAVCYAMKEEMIDLFELRDPVLAMEGWTRWFDAAKESGIPSLIRFAELKERRLEGLVSHAEHPIGTGKLEGFNNKIKVAKRIGYGYRNEVYFFTLIRYLTIPSIRKSHNFP